MRIDLEGREYYFEKAWTHLLRFTFQYGSTLIFFIFLHYFT